jgi:AcrR family transcriptional regulator
MESRRAEYTEATRVALLDSATTSFATLGFSASSLEAIARDARVTKGAVYHHFTNKHAVFQTVLERLDGQAVERIAAKTAKASSTWEAAVAGFEAFLDCCLDPIYQRICFEEGPTALGFTAWWEHGETHVAGLLRAMLASLRDEGTITFDDLDATAAVLYGAVTASALAIARSSRPRRTRNNVRDVILQLMEGMRPAKN